MFPFCIFAQQQTATQLQPLTKHDSVVLSKIPELRISDLFKRRVLPPVVDNSLLPFMRPLIGQVGLECGQASSIGNMFTYEINAKRRVPGDIADNQYATHFTYNFINGGSDAGINYYETFEIVKYAGNPSVADYGGMANGGSSRWMSGYDNYYKAMKNRIENVYSIRTNTIDGLNTLKNWIYDHGAGSDYGGMASFYSQYTSPPTTLPPGTPEAGKHVIYQWGSSPNHAMTIVGYHDSICWDYNNDGQYTNHLDINGDGMTDVRDWEIGGFKMANTYGGISGWGDQGYSYMMYKTVADISTQGGIWNNQVVVVDAKENHEPMLTAKVSITYPCRNKIKLMAGVSNDLLSFEPEHVLQFPMFDFQGGCAPMQGNSGNQTIEIGLDLNPLLEHVVSGNSARFFLMLVESDPSDGHQGTINSFSLMDYSGGGIPVEIPSTQSNVVIQNNTVTTIGITTSVDYNAVNILTDEIPPFQLYANNAVQLQAEGGSMPYYWYLRESYDTLNSTSSFPLVLGTQVMVSNNNDGIAAIDLPFEFPFYGEKYNRIYVAVDGFIMFDESLVPWPYYVSGKSYLIQNKIIAPTLSKPFIINPSNNDGIWVEYEEGSTIIVWKLSVYGQSGNSEVSMAARLFEDGKIEFLYGTHLAAPYTAKFAGISAGDGVNNVILNETGTFIPFLNQHTEFIPQQGISNVTLSRNGLLEARIDEYYPGQNLTVMVSDQNNIRSTTSLTIDVVGVVMNYEIVSGDDNTIEFGEDFSIGLQLENMNVFDLSEGVLSISGQDEYFEIIDNETITSPISIGSSINVTEAFNLHISTAVPNAYTANFEITFTTAEGIWSRTIQLTAYAPAMKLLTINISDGENGILEPGETANLVVRLMNNGGAPLHDLFALISSNETELTILSASAEKSQLLEQEVWEAVFQLYLSEEAVPMQIIDILLEVQAANDYSFEKNIPIITSLLAENFESGNFELFDWEMSGSASWTVTNMESYEGDYAARSGVIGHNEFSTIALNYEVAIPDTLSFYYKVSSESSYDFLKFSVNGLLEAEWSGQIPWTRAAYLIENGEQTFRWRYEKDYSVETGSDCAWIDYIVFPAMKIYTSVQENENDERFILNVSPNPVGHHLTISVFSEKSETFRLMLIDLHGRILFDHEEDAFAGSTYSYEKLMDESYDGTFLVVLQSSSQTLVKKIVRPLR